MKQLAPYPLIRPGFKGLNTEKAADTTIGGAFALTLTNTVFDKAGRIAARKGWVQQHPLGVGGAGDQFFDDVSLLCHFEGANAATTFLDSSSFAHAGAMGFSGALDTGTKEFGVSSFSSGSGGGFARVNSVDPIADELQIIAARDFTVEAAFWKNSNPVTYDSGIFFISRAPNLYLQVYSELTTGKLRAKVTDASGVELIALTSAASICDGVWHQIAFVRSGTTYSLYLDGTRVDTDTDSGTVGHDATQCSIGMSLPGEGNGKQLRDGWLDEVRFTNGTARYSGATYTLPTAAFPDNGAAIPTAVGVMHEWIQANGSTDIITAGDNKLFQGITIPVDRTGTLTPTADNWQFVNFRGYVLGFQASHEAIIFTGSGPFKEIVETNGTAPAGNAAVAAFGRVWAVDSDKQTIKYCALLDPYDWGSSDSGIIDMRTIWTKGMDEVVGMTAFGASLVVFGKRHIIIWTDGQGSLEGMDPLTMYVADTIEGTGLAARDSIQSVGTGDVIYLSPTGLQSLARIIVNKNNPLQAIDGSISRYLRGYTSSEDPRKIRSLYNARDEFYLLVLPKSGVCFCFSTREALEDGSLRVSEWDDISPLCGVARVNGNVLLGFPNYFGKYSGYLDNGATYTLSYRSPWMTLADLAPELEFRNKIPKRIGASIYTGETTDITYEWGFDFNTIPAETLTVALTNTGRFTEYGQGEYGANGVYDVDDLAAVAGVDVAEYGGSLTLSLDQQEMSGDGRWIQFGLDAVINDAEFTIQQLDLYCKVGAGIR